MEVKSTFPKERPAGTPSHCQVLISALAVQRQLFKTYGLMASEMLQKLRLPSTVAVAEQTKARNSWELPLPGNPDTPPLYQTEPKTRHTIIRFVVAARCPTDSVVVPAVASPSSSMAAQVYTQRIQNGRTQGLRFSAAVAFRDSGFPS